MILPQDPAPGLVLRYAYLWSREYEAGSIEGRKDRPVVVVLARRDLGPSAVLYVAPVTHRSPDLPHEAVEIPAIVKRHLGMDADASFIMAGELNVFVWPGPDLRPIRRVGVGRPEDMSCAYGYLPRGLFRSLKDAIAQTRRLGPGRIVKR